MPTLFDISNDLLALEEVLTEIGGEITDEEIEAELDDWFAGVMSDIEHKADNYCALIREIESRINARDAEIARMVKLVKTDRSAVDRLKGRLLEFFEAHGMDKLETQRFRLSVRSNGGKAPLVVRVKPEELPTDLQHWTVQADNERIRTLLESGEELPFATLAERGRHLRIQ